MCRDKGRSQGFTLVASLLVLLLLSAIAVSLLFMVQGAGQVGNNDVETSQAYYGAESGMELLTANLAALYQQSQSPTPGQITALTNNPPTSAMIGSMAYQESITWTPDVNGNPASHTSVISPPSSNAGLSAEIIPLTLKVVATRPGGASVNMTQGCGSGAYPGLPVRGLFRQRPELLRRPRFRLSRPGAHQWEPVPGRRQRECACS